MPETPPKPKRRRAASKRREATGPKAPGEPPPERGGGTRPIVLVAALGGAIVLASLIVFPWHSRRSESDAPRVPDDVTALLQGLAPGDALEGWTVKVINPPRERTFRVDLEKDGVAWSIYVSKRGATKFLPPRETERYALFYGGLLPPDAGVEVATFELVLGAVARRIEATEAKVAEPNDL